MDPVSETTQAAAQQQNSVSGNSSTSDVNKDEFMKLLVAQLQNQDPMNPVDNQQFLSQLATFSSLEQLISINSGISELENVLKGAVTATPEDNG